MRPFSLAKFPIFNGGGRKSKLWIPKYDFEEPILTKKDAYDNDILFSADALSRYPSINTRSEGGEGEMRSAIKYLQDLDDFYSQIARPRWEKLISTGFIFIPIWRMG